MSTQHPNTFNLTRKMVEQACDSAAKRKQDRTMQAVIAASKAARDAWWKNQQAKTV